MNTLTAEEIANALADWSKKYPRGVTYSMNSPMDKELIELEEKAKAWQSNQFSKEALPLQKEDFNDIANGREYERWPYTEAFVAACKAVDEVIKYSPDGFWSIVHINTLQDKLLMQGYSIMSIKK